MKILNYGIDIFLIGYMIYFLLFVFLGLRTKKNNDLKEPANRFAVIIPAHNEEKVIDKLIENLRNLNYPKDLYDIYVVADNCEDDTAQKAKEQGVNVLSRFNQEKKGKGYALRYAFRSLGFLNGKTDYDAAVVFDADNLVQENFLKAMNTRLLQGEKIIQAYIDSKNPADNWVTATFSMMFWINDRYNLLSRFNVGLSSVLMGTGMCISKESLAEIGWDTVTLTEDLEYSIQALLKDTKTTFARETKIFDEKPVSFYASCRQRLRWGRGQLSVLFKYIPKMMLQGIKELNIVKIDSAMRLIQQPFLMTYFVVTILRLTFPGTFNSPLFNLFIQNIKTLGFILPIMPFIIPSSVYLLDNLSFDSFKYVIFFPIFMYSWVLILYYALFTLNNKSWLPTEHFRSVSHEELQKNMK